MEWTGSAKAVFCLLVFFQMSCHQWMVNAAPLAICVDQDLTITADSNLHLFIDGVEVNLQYPTFPGNADTTLLPASAQVVAVSGQNEVIKGGFLGSFGTFVTDASWKCTDQFYEGWQEVGLDDSAWKQAYEARLHGESPWYDIEGIRPDARWIWIKPEGCIPDGIITVYCRKSLVGTCETPPPPPTTTTTQSPPSCPNQPPTAAGNCSGTGPTCITSCIGREDGYYQSCLGCNAYVTCSVEIMYDNRPCAECRYWDDNVKKCEYNSTTCTECNARLCSGTGAACIGSCSGKADGDYQSCKGWNVYATCSNGRLFDERPCTAGGL